MGINKWLRVSLVFLFLLSSCNSIKQSPLNAYLKSSNCNQQNLSSYSTEQLPIPLHKQNLDPVFANKLSPKALNVANSIGILDLLTNYYQKELAYKRKSSTEAKLDMIDLSQSINQKINIASLEISAVASELDCEEERTQQIATYLGNLESDKESKLTVGAIVVGATSAILAGLFINSKHDDVGDYIGLGAGIAEAGLGLAILANKKKVDFYHERNALRDIWEGHETSTVFSPAIWYYLNYYNEEEPESKSLRYQIIDKWMNFGQIAETKNSESRRALINLYFGTGGKYTSEQLKNRADMLDQLESNITLMKQDLKSLAIEFENSKMKTQ